MNVIIYGAGATGRKIYGEISVRGVNTLAFADSNPSLWGNMIFGKKVISPDEILNFNFDKIIVATIMSYEQVANILNEKYGISYEIIDTSYVSGTTIARDRWLSSFAQTVYDRGLPGSVAEGGVCEGIFAQKINAAFPDKTLYLFDTFEGFDERDTIIENKMGLSDSSAGLFNLSSENKVLSSLSHPEKAVIRKGYFPETTIGIDDIFVFVNLDFDLYNPTRAGLEFFYPKMAPGGVIIIHDFFNIGYPGIKKSVGEFCSKNFIPYISIGDEMSVAVVKQ